MNNRVYLSLSIILILLPIFDCDITNLHDVFAIFKQNTSYNYPVGFLSQANFDAVKRYMPGNIKPIFYNERTEMLKDIENESTAVGVLMDRNSEDLEDRFHVFSSLIISPQAMMLAPDFDRIKAPYGLTNQSSHDLFEALNAAIVAVQAEGKDETLLTSNNITNRARVYSCYQASPLSVVNGNESMGYLREILSSKQIIIGGVGPTDWGDHEGNYKANPPVGFYPQLLEAIIAKLAQLKGPDGVRYADKLTIVRKYYENAPSLFKALLDQEIHATDVYLIVSTPYTGTGAQCSNSGDCHGRESCVNGSCAYPERPRSLHFRATCTTSSRDTKFISKKDSRFLQTSTPTKNPSNNTNADENRQTPKTRWVGFILIFVALFGTIFIALTILVRRKKHYHVEQTFQGGVGKFVRLQEESEPPIESMDSFDDHVVQSPRDNTNSIP